MGKGSRRGSGQVRLFVGNRGSGRVGSTFRRVARSSRVQEKCAVDNSDSSVILKFRVVRALVVIVQPRIASSVGYLVHCTPVD